MKRLARLTAIGPLMLLTANVLAHQGHSPMGSVNHELEHGMWLVAALALGIGVVGYRWLKNR